MSDCTWLYDIGTQSIAGAISAAVVGAVLLRVQHRMEKRLERDRAQRESRRELLNAAFRMYQLVSWTFAGTGSRERVAEGWNKGYAAAADWAAIETARRLPKELVILSRKTREELGQDLVAILGQSGINGEPAAEDRSRWLAIGHRRAFEPLEPLIEACEREMS